MNEILTSESVVVQYKLRLKTSSRIAREEDEVTSNMCQFGLAILFVERVGIGLVLKCLEKTIKEH